MQADLTSGETAYLVVVITAFIIFAVTLFLCRLDYDRWLRGRADKARHLANVLPQAAE